MWVERRCAICNGSFWSYRSAHRKYCSPACFYTTTRIPMAERFWTYVDKTDGCWLWLGATNTAGYGKIASDYRPKRTLMAHRVSWELSRGALPPDSVLCHVCDIPSCVRPDHLFVSTFQGNATDMVTKRRSNFGERRYNAKLNAEQVGLIRARYGVGGVSMATLAREHGVTTGLIQQIVRFQRWKQQLTAAT